MSGRPIIQRSGPVLSTESGIIGVGDEPPLTLSVLIAGKSPRVASSPYLIPVSGWSAGILPAGSSNHSNYLCESCEPVLSFTVKISSF